MKQLANNRNLKICRKISNVLMLALGFLLYISNISSGQDNLARLAFPVEYTILPVSIILLGIYCSIGSSDSLTPRGVLKNNWYIFIYIALRIGSGVCNGLSGNSSFWTAMCYEVMFLIGINQAIVSERLVRLLLTMFVSFDIITLSICSFRWLLMREEMTAAVEAVSSADNSLLPFSFIFYNPNHIGLMAGMTVVILAAALKRLPDILRYAAWAAISLNVVYIIWTQCRTGAFAAATTVLLMMLYNARDFINYKRLVGIVAIVCICMLVPVYTLTGVSEAKGHLQNSEFESELNDVSSGRYNLWKEHIESQKGHYLLGYGSVSQAISGRTELITEAIENGYEIDSTHSLNTERGELGPHNGYLELMLTAGFPAFLMILLFLYHRIRSIDNEFFRTHQEMFAVIYVLIICTQETRFIVSSVRYFTFLMMILLCWGGVTRPQH